MVNGRFNLSATSRDLGVERVDAFLQLGNRQRIEILSGKLRDQIARAAGKAVVGFHRATSVDRAAAAVNKRWRRLATKRGRGT